MSPRELCAALLAALEASEGRRRSRKRDQTPDAIGLAMKRQLLLEAIRDDPCAEAFEDWLLFRADGPAALMVLEDWRMAQAMPEFAAWLARGAPSEDLRHGE
ncbi:MAG TPA: hypothetical protein VFC18_22255 [Burkholderiales bacterium]|nr:hypothetical protein [Burkholderiales bacterium]